MHSTAIIALAIAVAASPAFAAPASIPAPAASVLPASASPAPVSGAFEITPSLIHDVLGMGSSILEGASSIKELVTGKDKRAIYGDIELLARQLQADQSGAFEISPSLIHDVLGITSSILEGASSIKELVTGKDKRAIYGDIELLARQLQADQSGALNLGSLFKIGTDVFDGIENLFGGGNNNNNKRELHELFARAVAQAASTTPTASSANPTSTATVNVAVPLDASGALNLGSLFSGLLSGIESLFGGGNSKRELHELFVRAVAQAASTTPAASSANPTSTATANVAAPTDVSGAFDFLSLISTVVPLLATLKRDDLELMARDHNELFARAVAQAASPTPVASSANPTSTTTANIALPTDASGAFDLFSFLGSIVSSILKREDLELMAREPIVVLPGQPRPNPPQFNNGHFHPLILSKIARSLNDLD